MQAGVISEENLAQILRGISQKRRHGVLEVHAGDRVIEITFFQGKIVDVLNRRAPLARRVAERLVRRGLLAAGEWVSAIEKSEQLAEHIRQTGDRVPSELLVLAREQQALDDLYRLELVDGSYYHFRVEMVAGPEEGELQLSVGQLLLDLVAIKESKVAFGVQFPEDLVLQRNQEYQEPVDAAEHDILGLVDGESSLVELRAHSLLGKLLFEETITRLVACGALVEPSRARRPGPVFDLSALDASIDRYTADACRELDQKAGRREDEAAVAQSVPAGMLRDALESAGSVLEAETGSVVQGPDSTVMARLNRAMLDMPQTPEIVLGLFALMALAAPLIFW